MPMPTASSVFQGSWPIRPGSSQIATRIISGTRASGKARRPPAIIGPPRVPVPVWVRPWDSCAHFTRRENKRGSRSGQKTQKAAEAAFFRVTRSSGNLFGYCRRLLRVFLAEFFHEAGGVDDFLFPGVERVAVGAHLDVQGLAHRSEEHTSELQSPCN